MTAITTPRYITVGELQTLLWVSAQEELLKSVILWAEALFDTLIGADDGLIEWTRTEDHPSDDYSLPLWKLWRVFQLRAYRPTVITTINTASPGTLTTDYVVNGQELEFKDTVTPPSTFPYRYRIVYTAGYKAEDIPQDIKMAIKYIANGLYQRRKSEGVSSFRQDLLWVTYDKSSIIDLIGDTGKANYVTTIINKYTVHNVLST